LRQIPYGHRSILVIKRKNLGLPQGEIVIGVINDSRNATVGVVLGKFWSLLLLLIEAQVNGLVRQAELF
jgi:hypothetical protein